MKRAVLGLTSKITIYGKGRQKTVTARVDTGATKASIDKTLAAWLKLVPGKRTKIVKSSLGVSKRPVIEIKVKVDGKTLKADFTVAERSYLTYPVLIGQNILRGGKFIIDPLQ
ncbi:MAG: ATP-dependent zinc protease [Nanoarchaeota archaeon]|nr:ATP-dependent zinc protease [Nanoarchaeota archaeon]